MINLNIKLTTAHEPIACTVHYYSEISVLVCNISTICLFKNKYNVRPIPNETDISGSI